MNTAFRDDGGGCDDSSRPVPATSGEHGGRYTEVPRNTRPARGTAHSMESTRWRARAGVVLVCRAAVELTTDYLERALSRRDRRRFEAHVRVCAGCRVYLEQLI